MSILGACGLSEKEIEKDLGHVKQAREKTFAELKQTVPREQYEKRVTWKPDSFGNYTKISDFRYNLFGNYVVGDITITRCKGSKNNVLTRSLCEWEKSGEVEMIVEQNRGN